MKAKKSYGLLMVLFWVAALSAGCSSGGDDSTFLSNGYDTYTTSGSDLVLKIPDTLDVSQDDIESIHYYADMVDFCYVTNRETVDIVLAEACFYYDTFYLFPEYFPENLDDILTVDAYVAYLRNNDIFTYYFSPDDFTQVMSAYSGSRAFIGISLSCSGTTITESTPLLIDAVEPHTRGWIDGLQAGDSIVEINGVSIAGMTLDAASLLFPTDEAETVDITVERGGVEITISTAAEENIGLLLDENIAYLNARSFTEITGEELRLDYEDLQADAAAAGGSIDKLILDLRGNGGGAYDGMLELVDYLIDADDGTNPILYISGPAVEEEIDYLGGYCATNIDVTGEANFVLLVDGGSASASEISAAALKYYDTAYLMGETTYGKGIGQYIFELVDGSGVVIPAVENLPPSGDPDDSYHGIGIAPDYDYSATATAFDDDPLLDAVVEYLTTGYVTTASIQAADGMEKSVSGFSVDPLYEDLVRKSRSGSYF